MTHEDIQNSVVQNLSDGVVVIGLDGRIRFCNATACAILGTDEEHLKSITFAESLMTHPENDAMAQALIDAIYSEEQPYSTIVPFYSDGATKHLRLVTSYFKSSEGKSAGFTIVISDLSELMELKDSLKAMQQIKQLNRKLNERNELLSKTFGQFLSDEIVSELLDTPDGLTPGGNKRNVTMMMSDLRAFTAMSEVMDADDLIAMLNHYLETMTDVIQKHSGTIIEFIGDGIMAVFGAPKYSGSHAADAVAAALEMQAAMEAVNRWNAERDYPILEMGIGLNSGEVIVGNIGSEKRMKYGVVGSNVNLCGRIESYTTGGQVLISPSVRELIRAPLEIEKEMTVLPKGADEEITLSHVVGIGEPYDIHIRIPSDAPKKLNEPIPICFNRVDGKHTMEKPYYGGILSVGHAAAELETETDLKLFENIRISTGGQLFCKVTRKNDNIYLLQYTSIPSAYEAWIRKYTRTDKNR